MTESEALFYAMLLNFALIFVFWVCAEMIIRAKEKEKENGRGDFAGRSASE